MLAVTLPMIENMLNSSVSVDELVEGTILDMTPTSNESLPAPELVEPVEVDYRGLPK